MHTVWQQLLQDKTINPFNPTDSAAFVELSARGLIQVEGPDAEKFLQGQLTCDCSQLVQASALYGAHCNPKGRIIANFIIFFWNNRYYLSLPGTMCDILLTNLKKFAIFSKVDLIDCSEKFLQFGLLAQEAEEQHDSYCIRLPDSTNRLLVISPADQLMSWRAQYSNLPLVGANIWQMLDVQMHIASITPATSAAFTPQAIDFDKIKQAINFEKGCYIGQEIVARMHYLGKSKDGLAKARALLNNEPELNAAITDEQQKTIGYIVNFALMNTDDYLLLINLRKESKSKGKRFYQNTEITIIA